MRILLSHPTGNANVRSVVKAFNESYILDSFHTSIASFSDSVYDKLSKFKPFGDFNRRKFDDAIKDCTFTYPSRELGRIISTKLNIESLIAHEKGFYSVDSVYGYIDTRVSRLFNNKTSFNAVYCYEDCALNTFTLAKKSKISCFYDLPIGYWRTARRLLEDERNNRPEWSNTLTGLKDSENKLIRKDTELSLANHIFVASSFTAKTLEDYPNKLCDISIIPYGFPETTNLKIHDYDENRPLKLLFVGSLSQRKGIANVLEAVDKLGNNVSLTIVGHKVSDVCVPLNDGLKKHIWMPSLSHSAILDLMRKSDVLLFPSLFEGFGLVITESMSQGTPVITTDRTAGKDFIENNVNGWIVNAGSTQSLRAAIEGILNNPATVARVGLAAQKTAASRTWFNYQMELLSAIKSYDEHNK